MLFKFRKLPNGKRALFILNKDNSKHIKFSTKSYTEYGIYGSSHIRWICLGKLEIKLKGFTV